MKRIISSDMERSIPVEYAVFAIQRYTNDAYSFGVSCLSHNLLVFCNGTKEENEANAKQELRLLTHWAVDDNMAPRVLDYTKFTLMDYYEASNEVEEE